MAHFLRQPLVQFLIGGALLYAALIAFGPRENEGDNSYLVVVDDPALLTYLQYQDKAFDTAQARQLLSSLDGIGRARLETEYIRDEIMVREAVALGLDQNDDVIRQRLIQKMDFIFQGFSDKKKDTISNADIEAYYASNNSRYQQPAQATFTHIFFDGRDRGLDEAKHEAETVLAQLNEDQVPFEQAGQFGDRFFFLRNYVERSDRLVADHFGPEMAAQIFAADASSAWTGPFQSKYGYHLVMMRSKQPVQILPLEAVASQVIVDMERDRLDAARLAAYQRTADNYTVILQAPVTPKAQ